MFHGLASPDESLMSLLAKTKHACQTSHETKNRGFKIGLAGCGMRVKMEAGCGMTEILIAGCGMKIGRRDRDKLRFVSGIGDWTSIGRIII